MRILDGVKGPGDLKKMSLRELSTLAGELREKIISTVAHTGGHLGASLGAVELTIALHRVFDSPEDKIIWDVGHQTYAHKILTGRAAEFDTLRQYGGLSGFPKRRESPHDPFGTGHASTSISAALGFAISRDILGQDHRVVAVIGDGATTGGMAFEALNHAGRQKARMVIVLNDNGMSISSNVGAMAQYLATIRTGPAYKRAKEDIENFLRRIPVAGSSVADVCRRVKDSLKYLVVPGVLFEELGFVYLGPVNGHDIRSLEAILGHAARLDGPCLVHVVTQKGKGYGLAERDPDIFHGPGPFDPVTGAPLKAAAAPSFSACFGDAMAHLAGGNPLLVAITAAMTEGTGLARFAREYPQRLFDVGIAEQHATTFAAGLAAGGLRPVVAVYSTFLQRAYDQISHDVCLQNLPVIFAIDRAGLVGEDGETHQGVFDLAYLLPLPNMTIMAPSGHEDLVSMLESALRAGGPCAIRYPRGSVPPPRRAAPFEWGKSEMVLEGGDISILSIGHCLEACLRAAESLKHAGVSAAVINARFIKPLDWVAVSGSAKESGALLVVEEGVAIGGAGSYVLGEFGRAGMLDSVRFGQIGVPDTYIEQGPVDVLRRKIGLDSEAIAAKALLLARPRRTR